MSVPQVIKVAEIMHQSLVYNFQMKLIEVGQNPPSAPAEQSIDTLKIVQVKTSDGKGDNMLTETADYWTCKGNCTATFDLGGLQQVGEIFVRFAKDAERTASFEISLSSDGINWLVKLTGEQQGQGGVILNIIPFFDAKFVRFVGQGNSTGSNSIEYVRIGGKKLTEPVATPEPKPEPEKKPEPTTKKLKKTTTK